MTAAGHDASDADAPLHVRLAEWATSHRGTSEEMALADRSLIDTLAVIAAALDHPDAPLARQLGVGGRIAMLAHLIDYDDLHVPTTTHVSAVCTAAALASGGGAEAYLAGAGVMARLGAMLGWSHYEAGWHATCTAGAPAAAVVAGFALGLDTTDLCTAMALAVPAAGGVNRAFGTAAKSLQVGFAVDAGVRAATLAAAGASADGRVLEQWLTLVGGAAQDLPATPAIPGGLAAKAYPCCYALQRPIAAMLDAAGDRMPAAERVRAITVRAPAVTVSPLIHDRPRTGLEAKFSLQYAIAAVILDGTPGLGSFTDRAVGRPAADRLIGLVELERLPGGEDLLAGSVDVDVTLDSGKQLAASVTLPPGAPGRPLTDAELARKLTDCAGERDARELQAAGWPGARELIDGWLERGR
jgi:2-methylcitrate dehydratase PrpD